MQFWTTTADTVRQHRNQKKSKARKSLNRDAHLRPDHSFDKSYFYTYNQLFHCFRDFRLFKNLFFSYSSNILLSRISLAYLSEADFSARKYYKQLHGLKYRARKKPNSKL